MTERIRELEADLAHARLDLAHASTPIWRNAARRAIKLIEQELKELRQNNGHL